MFHTAQGTVRILMTCTASCHDGLPFLSNDFPVSCRQVHLCSKGSQMRYMSQQRDAMSMSVQNVLPAAVFLDGARCQVLLNNNLNTPISVTGTSARISESTPDPDTLDAAVGSRRKVLQTGGRIQAIDGQLYGVDGLPLTINVSPQAREVHWSLALSVRLKGLVQRRQGQNLQQHAATHSAATLYRHLSTFSGCHNHPSSYYKLV